MEAFFQAAKWKLTSCGARLTNPDVYPAGGRGVYPESPLITFDTCRRCLSQGESEAELASPTTFRPN